MNFRQDQVVLQLNQSGNLPGGASSALHAKRMQMQHFDQGIPMLDRNGPRRTTMETQTTSVSTPSTSKLPATRSYSTDSVYTILIRLPTQQSLDGDPSSESNQASIKMIVEEDGLEAETSMASGVSVRGSESLGALSVYRANATDSGNGSSSLRHGSLRASEIALETIRLPLNTRLVPKQIVKHRVPKKKRKQQERKQEKKAAKTLSAILLAFIITWTPYNVLVLIKTLSSCQDDDCIPMGLWNFAYYLCYINSTVNPLCYALCNANFRRTYIRILSCKWHNTNRQAVNRGYFS